MSPRGRIAKPDDDRRGGHRRGVGKGDAVEVAPVERRLVGAEPPEELSELAQEVWRICISDMAVLGHLREPDLILMRGYCQTAASMIETEALIREYGTMQKMPITATDPATGDEMVVGWKLQPNPAVKQHRELLNVLRLMSNELGLNPLARIRGNLMQAATASIALGIRDEIAQEVAEQEAKPARKPAAARKAGPKK